jgi:hypothetical protein
MEGLECKKRGEISVTVTIFGRREFAVADDVYIRNGSRTNIGARLTLIISTKERQLLRK